MIHRFPILLATLTLACASPAVTGVEPDPRGSSPVGSTYKRSGSVATYPDMFRVKPSGKTFSVPRDLGSGEVLRLTLDGLGEAQRLRLHRCGPGPGCRTASTEATWGALQLPPDGRVEVTIQVPGRYYLWIEDFSERSRPIGKGMIAESVRWEGQTLVLGYGTGLEVIAEPVQRGLTSKTASSPPETAAGKDDFETLVRLCQSELERGRYVEAISAARGWLELAGTPAERARASYHLGLGLVQRGLPAGIWGAESYRQAAEAFQRAAAHPGEGRPSALLGLADVLSRLDEHGEVLSVLDEYAAASGEDPLAERLRCWAEFSLGIASDRQAAAARARQSPGDGRLRAPVRVHSPSPAYTDEARERRIEGVVIIEMAVGRTGRVACARVLRSLDDGLDAAALDAARRWRFKPATINGHPVATTHNITMQFTLQ